MHHLRKAIIASLVLFGAVDLAAAEVLEFEDRAEWESAAGAYTTIDFTGFPDDTIITDQYSDMGVLFPDGDDYIYYNNGFLNDGVGLAGGLFESVTTVFLSPQQWIALDFPGPRVIELYRLDEMIYESSELGGSGYGHFAGLVSTEPFDRAIIRDSGSGTAYIDDLYFGPPIPAPGALVLFGLATLAGRRRRRSLPAQGC